MNNYRINHRYATALFEFASERNEVEETFKDIKLIAKTFNENRNLRILLRSPVVFGDKKLKILSEIFKDKIGKVTSTFIEILIRKRREEHLHGIACAYIDIYHKSTGQKIAQIVSAIELDESIKQRLVQLLSEQLSSEIILEEKVDPSIIGGLIVSVEGFKYDDSIKKKIQNLQKEFNVNTYIKGY